MALRSRYEHAKSELLHDPEICSANRELFERFFAYEEYKLKRMNGLAELDDNAFRTLLTYCTRFRTVNRMFANKPWVELTKEDIKSVYDRLEDGTLRTLRGQPFEDRSSYYKKIMLSKPFELAGKKALVKEVLEFSPSRPHDEVRFIREGTFRQLVECAIQLEHRALLWLAWDIGENVTSLLELRKGDFTRKTNGYSQAPEYAVALRREILKRSRTPRTEITNYKETVELLDRLLAARSDHDIVFDFGQRAAQKLLSRAVRITGARCIPNGEPVSVKDLRSSMACDLLSKGWTTDEVNQRLGHRPSSREIDKYVNWLALGRDRPKRRLHDNDLAALNQELQQSRSQEQLMQQRLRSMRDELESLKSQSEQNNRLMFEEVRRLVSETKARYGVGENLA